MQPQINIFIFSMDINKVVDDLENTKSTKGERIKYKRYFKIPQTLFTLNIFITHMIIATPQK